MEYRAVGRRIAVNLKSLNLPISNDEALEILKKKGFIILDVDIIHLARECMKSSSYQRGAKASEAPAIVDCSSFTKWLYGMRGIWLPRRTIQQLELGQDVALSNIIAGDLVFIRGWINYYRDDKNKSVGHVGIATGVGTVIHAANKRQNVIETPLDEFVADKLQGVRRYIDYRSQVLTFEVPPNREIEVEDDLRWVILQTLPKEGG